MIWKWILRRIMTFICQLASVDIWYIHWTFNKKKTSQKKFDVNSRYPRRARWDFRGVLDHSLSLYLEFDMNKYLKNWGNYEVLRMKFGDLLLLLLLFIYWRFLGSCPAMRWFVCEFEFLLHWLFHTYSSHFVLMCFCVYIHILPLCCMPQLLIFLRCSPAFVILPVSILLVFMHLLSEPCLLLYTPHRQKTPWFSACPYSSGGDAPHAIP